MSPILTGRSLDAPRMRDWTRRAVLCGKSIGALSHSFVSVFFNHGEHRGSQRKCARGTTAKNAKHAKVARARIGHVFSRGTKKVPGNEKGTAGNEKGTAGNEKGTAGNEKGTADLKRSLR